jgi:hypothetical protein
MAARNQDLRRPANPYLQVRQHRHRRIAMTTPTTDQAPPTFVASERGLLITVLLLVLLGVSAVLVVMG